MFSCQNPITNLFEEAKCYLTLLFDEIYNLWWFWIKIVFRSAGLSNNDSGASKTCISTIRKWLKAFYASWKLWRHPEALRCGKVSIPRCYMFNGLISAIAHKVKAPFIVFVAIWQPPLSSNMVVKVYCTSLRLVWGKFGVSKNSSFLTSGLQKSGSTSVRLPLVNQLCCEIFFLEIPFEIIVTTFHRIVYFIQYEYYKPKTLRKTFPGSEKLVNCINDFLEENILWCIRILLFFQFFI